MLPPGSVELPHVQDLLPAGTWAVCTMMTPDCGSISNIGYLCVKVEGGQLAAVRRAGWLGFNPLRMR